jgi:hypothetical protein
MEGRDGQASMMPGEAKTIQGLNLHGSDQALV